MNIFLCIYSFNSILAFDGPNSSLPEVGYIGGEFDPIIFSLHKYSTLGLSLFFFFF